MTNPDLRVLVGVLGGTSISKDSGKLILDELRGITEKINAGQQLKVKFAVDKGGTKQQLQNELKQLTNSGVNVQIPVKTKIVGDINSGVFDVKQLETEGRKYYKATANILARAKKDFASQGTVDLKNVLQSPQGEIQSFTAAIKKADTTVEDFHFNLVKLTSGTRSFKGFAQFDSVLTDKSTGSGLQSTLNYLNNVETKIANITSKVTSGSSKPLLEGMPQFDDYNKQLQKVTARIQEIRNSTSAFSDDHKREVNSIVSDLQRYGKELQNAAYAGTELKAQTFTAQKSQYQADLEVQIKQWTNADIFGGDFERSANEAKTLLAGVTDTAGLDRYREKLKLLQTEAKGFKADSAAWDGIAQANTLTSNIETAQLKIKNLKKTYGAFVGDPQLVKDWKNLFDQSKIVSSEKGLTNLNAQITQFEQKLVSAGKHQASFFSEQMQNFTKMSGWMIMGGISAILIGGIKGTYTAVGELNTQMVDLKKVTDETSATYNKFLKDASARSIKLGSSITGLVEATANYAKLGFSIDEAEKLAEVAIIYKNVGDGIASVDDATQSIISTMKAFGIASSDAESIIDKFNEVGNRFSITSGGIGEALQRSASSLSAANNTLDESIALITATNNVIQDPDSVGTMWKTVAARIRGATTELEQAGLDTDYMADSTSKLREQVKALTNTKSLGGFDIMADEDTFKSTYDIILGISKVWKDMSDIDQSALLEMLAGKRQSNALAAAITNMSDAEKVLEASTNSAGSALAEHSKWLDSIEAKQQQFAAQYQQFSNTLLSSELIKGAIDTGTGLLGWLTAVIDNLGALPVLLSAFGGIQSLASNKGFFKLDTEKDWGGSGIGITTTISSRNKALADFAAQIETDYQALLKWQDAIDNNSVSADSFGIAMSGASQHAKEYAATMNDSSNTAQKFKVQQTAIIGATQNVGFAAKAASIGITILNTAMNMVISLGAGMALTALVSGMDALVNASARASEKANELAEEQRGVAESSAEESKSIEDLIEKYKQLRSTEYVDADSRAEARDIQSQITSLVGDQASNLDLVNGKLDDELKKLKEIQLESAKGQQDSYVASYHADRDAANKATGEDSYLMFDGYGYVGPKDDKAYKILEGITNGYGSSLVSKGGFYGSNLFSTETGTAEERIKQLTAAMEALKNAADYDYTDSDLYSGLSAAISLYEVYVEKLKESANGLLESTVLTTGLEKEIAGATINSAGEYEKYRQSITDTVAKNNALSSALSDGAISMEDITAAVDDLMATKFPEWYDKVNQSVSSGSNTSSSSYKDIGEALSAAKQARDTYKSVQDDIDGSSDGSISLSTLTSLVSTYSDLEDVVTNYLKGTATESDILSALAKKYNVAANAAGYQKDITAELAEETDTLTERLSKLSTAKGGINSLSEALSEFKENKIVGADTLSGLSSVFGSLDGYENFVSVLGNSESTISSVKSAVNDLASEYILASGILQDLSDDTAALTIAQLKSWGVMNSEEVVTARLSAQKLEAQINTAGLTNATWETVEAFLQENGTAKSVIGALQALRKEQYNAKIAATDFTSASTGVIESLLQQATAAGIAAKAQSSLSQALILRQRKDENKLNDWEKRYYQQMMDQYAKEATAPLTDIAVSLPEVKINVPLSSSGSGKETEEYIADIDELYEVTKRLTAVQSDLNTVEAKANLLDDSDYQQRIAYAQQLLDLKNKENDLLHEQTELRRNMIQQNANELENMGFQVDYDPASNDLFIKNLDHINELVGKNQEETNDLRKKAEDLIDTTESLNDANVDSSLSWYTNADAAKEYNKQLMNIRQAQGDEWLDIRSHQNTLWENQGGNERNILANYDQMMDYVHNLANEYRDKNYSEESEEIRKLKELWWSYHNDKQSLISDIDQKHLDGLEKQKDAMQDILDLTIDLIKKETNDRIDSLEKARDIYKDIVDLKIESLELTERERSYQDTVDSLTGDLSRLQAQADALALDDSRDAALKRAQILEQINDKQKELSDEQHSYSVDNQKDALESEYELYSDSIDSKIDALKAFLDDNERLTAAAYKRIDTEGSSLYDNLLIYARKYTDTSESELKSMWDAALNAAKEYASFVDGLNAVDQEINAINSGGHSQKATDDSSVISEMKSNAVKWASASKSEQLALEDRNLTLGTSIGATRDLNGRWWRNGVPLYHTGGVIGEHPTQNQKDILMYGEKGELVLTKEMQKNFLSMPKAFSDLIAAGETALKSSVETALSLLTPKLPFPNINIPQLSQLNQYAAQASTGQGNTSMSVVFNVAGNMDDGVLSQAKKYFDTKLYEFAKKKS